MKKIIILLLTTLLTGCLKDDPQQIGIFITTDLLNDDITATKTYEKVYDDNNNEELSARYTFNQEGYENIHFFDKDTYYFQSSDYLFYEYLSLDNDNQKETKNIKVKVFIPNSRNEFTFYVNNIMQDSTGNVYVNNAAGIGMENDSLDKLGLVLSNNISYTNTNKIDGKKHDTTFNYTIEYELVEQTEFLNIIEMSKNNQIIDMYKLNPDIEKIDISDNAAYIIVDISSKNYSEKQVFQRNMKKEYNEDYIYSYSCNPKICIKNPIILNWQ